MQLFLCHLSSVRSFACPSVRLWDWQLLKSNAKFQKLLSLFYFIIIVVVLSATMSWWNKAYQKCCKVFCACATVTVRDLLFGVEKSRFIFYRATLASLQCCSLRAEYSTQVWFKSNNIQLKSPKSSKAPDWSWNIDHTDVLEKCGHVVIALYITLRNCPLHQ